MTGRCEVKYLLKFSQHTLLRDRLLSLLKNDSSVYNRYPVYSVYYDTPQLDFLKQKLNGEFEHLKIRLRSYQTKFSTKVEHFLETKYKKNNEIFKTRVLAPMELVEKARDPEQWTWSADLKRSLPPQVSEILSQKALIPVSTVYYEREVMEEYLDLSPVRITFDTHIFGAPAFAELSCESQKLLEPPYYSMLEIKYPALDSPSPLIKDELVFARVRALNFSKYATAMLSGCWLKAQVPTQSLERRTLHVI